jgi:membrane-associated phospholipid phosphatase
MPVTAKISAAIGLLFALVLGVRSDLDIALTGLFYDSGVRDFPISVIPWVQDVRWVLMHVPHLVTLLALAALVGKALRLPFLQWLPTRHAFFLLSTLLVIPGLVVNAGLKENWGRPRPHETVLFGGTTEFYPWWKLGGPCDDNCSFVSGEVSGVAWLSAAAALTPPNIRPFAVAGTIVVTAATAFLRVAFGGHWFSDVMISATLTFFLVAVMHRFFFGPVRRRRFPKPEVLGAVQP